MQNKPKVKILVTYHQPGFLIKNDVLVPIHAGRAIAQEKHIYGRVDKKGSDWLLRNTIGDDTCDNISKMNRKYSEGTALYWAWKNPDVMGNPDYVGLMHYRRHFILTEHVFQPDYRTNREKCYSQIYLPFANPKTHIRNLSLDADNICELCTQYDCICVDPARLELIGTESIYDDYKRNIPGVNIKDLDAVVALTQKLHPEYATAFVKYVHSTDKIWYNMFILRRDLFEKAMDFCFGILDKLNIDVDSYTMNGKRTHGYLLEVLMGFYLHMLKADKSIRSKTFPIVFLENASETKPFQILKWRLSYKLRVCGHKLLGILSPHHRKRYVYYKRRFIMLNQLLKG